MSDQSCLILTDLFAQSGPGLLNDARGVKAHLEASGELSPRKIQELMDVFESGMAVDLFNTGGRLPLPGLARRLADQHGLPEDLALWALQCWNAALVPEPQQPDPAEEITLQLAPGITMSFRFIPGGDFLYTENKQRVRINSFWMAKYPVTVAQFQIFLNSEAGRSLALIAAGAGPDHPVINVSWAIAAAFCQWAGPLCGQKLLLPTEAQWEKAARGTDGRTFPWGQNSDLLTYCNFGETFGNTTPVGYYSPQGDSPYGCADMAGNVWEWCLDGFAELPEKIPANPYLAENDSAYRVIRGGCWDSEWLGIRTYYRGRWQSEKPDECIGFRCCM
jgi:formylglycine-generating enzyme required for sulfatase activity